jgi:hypothetical protein
MYAPRPTTPIASTAPIIGSRSEGGLEAADLVDDVLMDSMTNDQAPMTKQIQMTEDQMLQTGA